MNEGKEIRFIDLFSGIGGFRLGLERAIEERRILRRQNMHGHRTDADECLKHGRKAPGGHISQESPCDSEIGLERANHSRYEEGGRAQILQKNDANTPIERLEGTTQGYRCVWSCDNNKYANQIYTKQFGEANHHTGDIRGVNPEEISDFDLLCAGFPCQSFSVAGPRTGFQDTRGTLFFEISRIAEAKRPQMLLLENVKGLLSSDRGQTFQTILQELGRIGYWAEWQVLNSKHHGVPQNRERVFIIGHLRSGSPRPIFPIGETDEMVKEDGRGRSPVQPEVSTAIDSHYGRGVDRHGQRTVVLDTFNRGGVKEGEAYALKTNPSPTSSAVIAIRPKDDWFSQHAIYPSKGIGPTLRGNQNDPAPKIFDEETRIRRLTPVECERLQGFPDGWTEGLSDTQRYKCLGNAVTTNVITFLGRRIMEAEE